MTKVNNSINAVMSDSSPAVTSNSNTSFGVSCMTNQVVNTSNTGFGYQALSAVTTSTNNTCFGYQAGKDITVIGTSNSNTSCWGIQSGINAATASNNTACGSNSLFSNTTGSFCTSVGVQSSVETLTANNFVAIGPQANGNTGSSTSNNSVAIGYSNIGLTGTNSVCCGSLSGQHGATDCVGVGFSTLSATTSGTNNTALGYNANNNNTTGSYSLSLGYTAGNTIANSNSNNISVANVGVSADTNVMRIGTQGSGNLQQNKCFIAGIAGTTVSNQVVATVNSSTGQLGQAAGTLSFPGSLATSPVGSYVTTNAFGNVLTVGTSTQNTLGYDIILNVGIDVMSSTTATIVVGVGPTSTPTTNTIVPSFTTATEIYTISFSVVVPNNYYVLVNTTGTIVVNAINAQACPI
jgi:trimeric autotransporter adhesin